MLMKTYHLAFFLSLIMGTSIACSANSWFTCWLGLEINLMSLIPLLIIKLSPLSTETAIKYFLAQAMASLMIIFSTLADSTTIYYSTLGMKNEIILLALSISAGVAPFHFWFPQVMKIADWPQCAMIITWQKIAPFILIISCAESNIIVGLILSSAIVGSLGGLNQMSMKMILTYSSIAHASWMLAICASSSSSAWSAYFLIYSTISVGVILVVYTYNMEQINQVSVSSWGVSPKVSLMAGILSLGGLPPFLGFTAKLTAMQLILNGLGALILFILISSSLVSLFYYTRMVYTTMVKTSNEIMVALLPGNQTPSFFITMFTLGNIMAAPLVLLI